MTSHVFPPPDILYMSCVVPIVDPKINACMLMKTSTSIPQAIFNGKQGWAIYSMRGISTSLTVALSLTLTVTLRWGKPDRSLSTSPRRNILQGTVRIIIVREISRDDWENYMNIII